MYVFDPIFGVIVLGGETDDPLATQLSEIPYSEADGQRAHRDALIAVLAAAAFIVASALSLLA